MRIFHASFSLEFFGLQTQNSSLCLSVHGSSRLPCISVCLQLNFKSPHLYIEVSYKGTSKGKPGLSNLSNFFESVSMNELKIPEFLFLFLQLIIYLFYFWLRWVFVAARGLSLVVVSGGYSSLRYVGFSLWWLLLLRSTGSRRVGFSSCGRWAQQLWLAGSRAQAQQLWRTGLVVPRHVGFSRTRARTRVPCIGRQILNHCATREVPQNFL